MVKQAWGLYCLFNEVVACISLVLSWFLNPFQVCRTFAVQRRRCSEVFLHFSSRFGLASCNRPFGLRCLWLCLLVLLQCRVGEAAHPGPHAGHSDRTFVIGCCNSSGLNGKAPMLDQFLDHGDLWTFSETHLSSRGMHTFRASLQFQQSPFRYCASGHPVAARAHSNVAGGFRGVAVVAKHPTRKVPVPWPSEIERSSRVMVSATHMFNCWLTTGVLYGEPEGPSHPRYRQHNEALLHHLASFVCHLSVGLRMVSGDFNLGPDTVPAFQILRSAGFRDIQELARERWGKSVEPTSKQRTLRDYCFVSPELQRLLVDVKVTHDIWPDHAVLEGHFVLQCAAPRRTVWKQPLAFPWPSKFAYEGELWRSSEENVNTRYASLWTAIEKSAASQSPIRVPAKAFGRGSETYTKTTQGFSIAPIKPSRRGEIEPEFHGVSVQHALWFRQARRLQSYVRHVRSRDCIDSPHAFQLWSSILAAKGFDKPFSVWWLECNVRVVGAPDVLPQSPPPVGVATLVFDSVLLALRSLEVSLKKSSRQYARFRRQKAPHLVFRDLKDRCQAGVDLLVHSSNAVISHVDPDTCQVTLDRPISWDESKPLLCQGKVVDLIHQEAEFLWVANCQDVAIGATVAQVNYTGALDELFQAFGATWTARWQRHQHVPQSQWTDILDFARRVLPRHSFDWPAMQAADLKRAIAIKKGRTAKGLDGVSLADLKAQPLEVLHEFCEMFASAELTGEWPEQLVSGRVTALPKCDTPTKPDDFRPICVLGVLYRCWSSCQSKHLLQRLDPLLPAGLFGSRPHCHASQIWHHLMWAVEAACIGRFGLHGLMADIQKAFNALPRPVVFEVLAWCGAPFRVLRGWAGALSVMQRRFLIQGQLGPCLAASTGFPEGDGLSVVAMVSIDHLLHAWIAATQQLTQTLTFVDDWQFTSTCAADIVGTLQRLERFVAMVDIRLDLAKTYTWSVQGQGRQALRQAGLQVRLSGRNLGAHLQLCKRHSNDIQMERIRSVQPIWPKLRISTAPYLWKVRALRQAAWPKALHGIPSTTVSKQCYQTLRTGAMQGLNADSAGTNAWVHLGLIEHVSTDPQCWAIIQTFRGVRSCGPAATARSNFHQVAIGTFQGPANGVTHTLVSRIRKLHWDILPGGLLRDGLGCFDLFSVGWAELAWRIELAWPRTVADQVHHRQGFHGLAFCDPEHTRGWLRHLNVVDQGAFRKVLNGTHICQDAKVHCQEGGTNLRPWCQCVDSRYHRFFICEHFESARVGLDPAVYRSLPVLPESLTAFGWSMRPSTAFAWCRLLAEIPGFDIAGFDVSNLPPGPLHLFTDGACAHQNNRWMRYAAWGVIAAPLDDMISLPDLCVAKGPLPGILQSAFRAELYALIVALEIARKADRPCFLWTDCSAAQKLLLGLIQGRHLSANHAHSDLVRRLDILVKATTICDVTHVHSHVAASASCPLESWACTFNDHADSAAKDANFPRDDAFRAFQASHATAVSLVQSVSRAVQHVQLKVSKLALAASDASKHAADEPVPIVPGFSVTRPQWTQLPPLCGLPSGAIRWYGWRLVNLIASWFWGVLEHEQAGSGTWVSHFQLYIDFQMMSGHCGPIHDTRANKWLDCGDDPLVGLRNDSFKVRTRWFAKVVKEILRHLRVTTVPYGFQRPDSLFLNLHCSCFGVPWPRWRLEKIDQWLHRHLTKPAAREGHALLALPHAERDSSMEFEMRAEIPAI